MPPAELAQEQHLDFETHPVYQPPFPNPSGEQSQQRTVAPQQDSRAFAATTMPRRQRPTVTNSKGMQSRTISSSASSRILSVTSHRYNNPFLIVKHQRHFPHSKRRRPCFMTTTISRHHTGWTSEDHSYRLSSQDRKASHVPPMPHHLRPSNFQKFEDKAFNEDIWEITKTSDNRLSLGTAATDRATRNALCDEQLTWEQFMNTNHLLCRWLIPAD